jgi:hypothetical protein
MENLKVAVKKPKSPGNMKVSANVITAASEAKNVMPYRARFPHKK